MNFNETKKIVDFMKENGISELEYTEKGSSIKLRLDHKALKNAKKAEPETEELPAAEVEEYEEPGLRDVTSYTAEATEAAEEVPSGEVEEPSAAVKAIVAVGSVRRRAVGAVAGLFKRRPAAAAEVVVDEDEDDEEATELDVMRDHEEAAKAKNPALHLRNPLSRFLKNQKDGADHAKSQLEDPEEESEEEVTAEAPVEEAEEEKAEKRSLFSRFRRKKEEPVEETEEAPAEEAAEDVTEEPVEAEEAPAEEEAPAAEETVEEPVQETEAPVEEAPAEEAVEEPAEETEDAEEAPAEEEAPAAETEEAAEEEEPSKEDALFGIVG